MIRARSRYFGSKRVERTSKVTDPELKGPAKKKELALLFQIFGEKMVLFLEYEIVSRKVYFLKNSVSTQEPTHFKEI